MGASSLSPAYLRDLPISFTKSWDLGRILMSIKPRRPLPRWTIWRNMKAIVEGKEKNRSRPIEKRETSIKEIQ